MNFTPAHSIIDQIAELTEADLARVERACAARREAIERRRDLNFIKLRLSLAMNDDQLVQVIYTDEDGVTSGRRIYIRRLDKTSKGDEIVRAFDTQRSEPRTFRLDRIEQVL